MAEFDVLHLQKEGNDKYTERTLVPRANGMIGFSPGRLPVVMRREYETLGQRAAHTAPGAMNNLSIAGFTSTVQFMHNLSFDKNSGRLIHFWASTTNHVAAGAYGIIVCRYSLDGGEIWSSPVVVANERSGQIDLRGPAGGWVNGRLFIFYGKYLTDNANTYEKWQGLFYKYSDDGGDTFSNELVFTPMTSFGSVGKYVTSISNDGFQYNTFCAFGHIIEDNGYLYQTWYAAAYTSAAGCLACKSVIARSGDNGLTWTDNFVVPLYGLGTGVSANNAPMLAFSESRLYKAGGGEFFMVVRKDGVDSSAGKVLPVLSRSSLGISNWGRKKVTVTADYTNDTFSATSHGFVNDNIVRIDSTSTIPAGLSQGVSYYVVNASANTFKLSLTSSGAALDITSNGSGTLTAVLTGELIQLAPDDTFNTGSLSKNITHDGCTVNLYGDLIFNFIYTNRRTAKARTMLARVDKIISDGASAFDANTVTTVFSYPSGGTAQAHGNGAAIAFDNSLSIFCVEQDQQSSSVSAAYFFRLEANSFFKWLGLIYDLSKFYNDIDLSTGKAYKINGAQIVGARQTAVAASSQESSSDATDLATALSLLNSLKAKYNALQTSYAGLITKLQAHGLIS